MFSITVTEKGGEQRRLDFDKAEITIGRVQGNDVILPKGNVSKRHARIVLKDGKFIIVDLKSTNGTYVNGRKITSPLVVKETDKIYIGDFILGVEESGGRTSDAARGGHEAPQPAPLPPPMGHDAMMGATPGPEMIPPGHRPEPPRPMMPPAGMGGAPEPPPMASHGGPPPMASHGGPPPMASHGAPPPPAAPHAPASLSSPPPAAP
ncbi:MAG TPA: FHA domain-containing protein, partial [Kofleriaceae bacterium]|nr:FHA domain-containing protein [Kofleriaceae bacterium]